MNKKEKEALLWQIAEWEWQQGGSSSEAAATSDCVSALRNIFSISDEELLPYQLVILGQLVCERAGAEHSDEWSDTLDDLAEEEGYSAIIDMVDREGWSAFHARVQAKSEGAV